MLESHIDDKLLGQYIKSTELLGLHISLYWWHKTQKCSTIYITQATKQTKDSFLGNNYGTSRQERIYYILYIKLK